VKLLLLRNANVDNCRYVICFVNIKLLPVLQVNPLKRHEVVLRCKLPQSLVVIPYCIGRGVHLGLRLQPYSNFI